MSETLDLTAALHTARRAVEAAARASLGHFRKDIAVEHKADGSPVTVADRESEAAILREIRGSFPRHAILTEESGAMGEDPECRWIVDPLDGTRGFRRGGSFWGPLVALELGGEIVVGAMALPASGETYWAARGMGSFRDGERLRVSQVDRLGDATVSLGELRALLRPPHGAAVSALMEAASSTRCYGDLVGCAMLLTGQADAWLEAGVNVWDLAALKVLVEEAGGRFTDFDGSPRIDGGCAIATNGRLHQRILTILAEA